jgi:hypothetical protein
MSAPRLILGPVEVVRAAGCTCKEETLARDLDLTHVAVILDCATCGDSRIALLGELPEVIDKLIDVYAATMDPELVPAAAERPGDEPAATGDAVDLFGQWLARQRPGTIRTPPRPPREARGAQQGRG